MDSTSLRTESKKPKEALKFWDEKLNNSIFTDIPRWSNAKLSAISTVNTKLPEELTANLINLNGRIKTSLKSVLLASHCKVLSVLSGNIDITTGYEITAKNEDGEFKNTLPLRVFCEQGSWVELIQKIEREEKEIFPFLNFYLTDLKQGLKLSKKLFETTFSFSNSSKYLVSNELSELNKKTGEKLDFAFATNFSYQIDTKTLMLSIEYNANEFSNEQINIICSYYINTLKLMASNGMAEHQEQSILSKNEREQLLEGFNNNKVTFPIEKTFIDLFEEQVLNFPNSIAVKYENIEFTYDELNNYTNKLANYLIENNINIEDSVVVVMERNHLWMAAVLGIMKAGGVYVPVRPDWPDSRKNTIIQKTKAKFIIVDDKNEETLFPVIQKEENKPTLINLDILLKNISEEENPLVRLKPDNLAYIIFTSGSTGEPKGAMIEHKGMLNHLFSKVNDLNLVNTDIIAQNSSQSFDISVWQLISGLLVGAKTVIYSDDLILDIISFLNEVKKDKITILELVPSYMKIVLQLSKPNSTTFDNIKYLLVTGEPLKIGLVTTWFNFFKIPLVNAYGPTEASDDITHHFMYETPKGGIVPVGKTIQNLNIYVVDSFGQLAPIGTKGQVYVSGVGVGRGYIGDLDKTKEVFTNDHLKPLENLKLYKTGDIGSWTNEGILHLFGREDNQIKLNGYRIDLGEIEQCLSKQNGVLGNAVLLKNKQLHAFLVFEGEIKNNQNLIEQCKTELKKNIPHYMIPRKFHILQKLPLTQNGKIDRKALQEIIPQKNN
jgi:amino acid adenylation domain-containing protein